MEYLALLCCCCKGNSEGLTMKISCNMDCCKNKTYKINVEKKEDIDRVIKILEELSQKK